MGMHNILSAEMVSGYQLVARELKIHGLVSEQKVGISWGGNKKWASILAKIGISWEYPRISW